MKEYRLRYHRPQLEGFVPEVETFSSGPGFDPPYLDDKAARAAAQERLREVTEHFPEHNSGSYGPAQLFVREITPWTVLDA